MVRLNGKSTHSRKTGKNWKLLSKFVFSVLVTLGVSNINCSALASGFSITEQSVKNLGNAASGGAARADDASTIFYNPAGLTRLSGNSLEGSGYIIFSENSFQNIGSTTATGDILSGGDSADGGVNSFIPNVYGYLSVSEDFKLGIGITPPFGLATDYGSDWVGRYQAVESTLTTININPSAAYKLNEVLSVGGGLNLQYADAKLTNAIDFGLIGQSAGLGTQSQQLDGFAEISGDDWSLGYNLGLLYEPSKTTRVGLAYRSGVSHTLEGDADFTVPTQAAILTSTGQFTDSDAEADLKLPDSLSLSIHQKVSDRWEVMGDVTWTNWSRFEELRIVFDNPAQPDSVEPENWEDTFRFGLGVNYLPSDKLTLRTGIAYDPTPVEDEFRTARIPDSDRIWLSFGSSYQISDSFNLDVAYVHIFFDDSTIENSTEVGGNLNGEFNSNADIVSLGLTWKF